MLGVPGFPARLRLCWDGLNTEAGDSYRDGEMKRNMSTRNSRDFPHLVVPADFFLKFRQMWCVFATNVMKSCLASEGNCFVSVQGSQD